MVASGGVLLVFFVDVDVVTDYAERARVLLVLFVDVDVVTDYAERVFVMAGIGVFFRRNPGVGYCYAKGISASRLTSTALSASCSMTSLLDDPSGVWFIY